MADPEMALLWLFDNLRIEPFGALPVSNLSSKGGPTIIKNFEQLGSYNWVLDEVSGDEENGGPEQTGQGGEEQQQTRRSSVLVVPGMPKELQFWNGGRLPMDEGYLLYDVNHLKAPDAPMDPIFLALKHLRQKEQKPELDIQQYDFVMDAINLQKLFAFAKGVNEEDGGGMFRIDLERVGRTVLACRVEAADVVPIDFATFDRSFTFQCTRPATKVTSGPYQQLASYQFGQLKMLVRFDAECADYSKLPGNAGSAYASAAAGPDAVIETSPFEMNGNIRLLDFGTNQRQHLVTTATFPHNRGFPFFTYARMFFTGIDQLLVGWWKGADDFGRPATYNLADIAKLMKPPPYVQLSKTYDCLVKLMNLMRKNREGLKIACIWKGNEFIEIYEKAPYVSGNVSDGVRAYLKTQVKEQMPGDAPQDDEDDAKNNSQHHGGLDDVDK